MKCKVTNCNNEMVIAGPPSAPDEGLCWDCGIKLADTLSEFSPKDIAVASAVFPIDEDERLQHPLNRAIASHLGGMTLGRVIGGV